jgi:L-ascorbate metabolism protein UlaG (beta-lactamase superfamily)
MPGLAGLLRAGVTAFAALALSQSIASAQRAQPPAVGPQMLESCPGLVASDRPRVMPASLRLAALAGDQARITYVGHSTFLIESPQLVRIATDYNDYIRSPVLPDIITMNHAHTSHYTDRPDPAIPHVLRGWAGNEQPARHDIQVKDVRVRNVPTNIRFLGGGTERHGNSIFIYEIGSLCIAHLGHLHHTLSPQQLNEIGRVDVVLVPIDGGATLDLDGMIEVLGALKAPVMIPMHYFSVFTLNRFIDLIKDKYTVVHHETPSIVLSRSALPATPQFLVLPGR